MNLLTSELPIDGRLTNRFTGHPSEPRCDVCSWPLAAVHFADIVDL